MPTLRDQYPLSTNAQMHYDMISRKHQITRYYITFIYKFYQPNFKYLKTTKCKRFPQRHPALFLVKKGWTMSPSWTWKRSCNKSTYRKSRSYYPPKSKWRAIKCPNLQQLIVLYLRAASDCNGINCR